MLRINRLAWFSLALGFSLVACGGGSSKTETKKPTASKTTKKKKPASVKKETEEDRAKKREAAAEELVAADSKCLPTALKDPSSKLTLELGALDSEAILCAMDNDPDRLLGAAGCWTIDLGAGGLTFRNRNAIPGRGYHAKIEGGCVRGFCLPKDQEVSADKPALIAWSLDASQAAVVAGDQVHLFAADSKELAKSIALRDPAHGDKAMSGDATGLWFLGDTVFLQGGEAGASSIWMYKADGSAAGQLMGLGKGNAAVSMGHGSFSILDKDRVAVAERGFSTLTIFEVASGKRSKLVRKVSAGPCKSAQVESYFSAEPGELPAKCVAHLKKTYEHFKGTTMVAGSKNFLGALGSDRVGELAVIDSKNLSEKRAIQLPWCESGAPAEAARGMVGSESADQASVTDDPDAGGQVEATAEAEEKPAKKKKKSSN
jgi:hypothetical protein